MIKSKNMFTGRCGWFYRTVKDYIRMGNLKISRCRNLAKAYVLCSKDKNSIRFYGFRMRTLDIYKRRYSV